MRLLTALLARIELKVVRAWLQLRLWWIRSSTNS